MNSSDKASCWSFTARSQKSSFPLHFAPDAVLVQFAHWFDIKLPAILNAVH